MIKTLKISGVTKIDFDPDEKSPYFYTSNEYVWIKNLSADTVYVSLSEDCGNGVDGTAAIAPYDAYMLILDSRNAFYAAGSGSIEVHTSDISTCPFKLSQKGGDISASGGVVQFGGLQGGVPFSEITVKGENPPITGQELTVTACGKNLIPYPHYSASGTQNGLTFTDNGDGTITVNGTASAKTTYYLRYNDYASGVKLVDGVTYTLSGCPEGGSPTTYANTMSVWNGTTWLRGLYEYGNGLSFMHNSDECTHYGAAFVIYQGCVCDNLTFRPQIEIGSTATAYEPYSGADYTITPDSNPYTVTTEIYQQNGINTIYVTGEGEPTLSVTGVKTNAAVKRIWDKLNELTTAIIVSNGEI